MFYLANKTFLGVTAVAEDLMADIIFPSWVPPGSLAGGGWHEIGESGEVAVVADSCNILLPDMAGGIFSSHK